MPRQETKVTFIYQDITQDHKWLLTVDAVQYAMQEAHTGASFRAAVQFLLH
jgi:hypothetical protein